VLVPATVSVFPTLQPLATKAASSAAERIKERLPSKLVLRLLSHAMRLIPSENIKNQKNEIFILL
jgi:hypothetical protein